MRRYYYISNVKYNRFTLEVRYLLPGYQEFGDLSNYVVVSSFFDVSVRLSSYTDDRNMRRTAAAVDATIAAWSVCDDDYGSVGNEQKGKTGLIKELGRVTFVGEQDCRLVQDLVMKANDLVSSMISAVLERPDEFIASLYYEEENDDSVILDITFSDHLHKGDRFGSEIDDDKSSVWNDEDNPPQNNNQNIHSMLAELAADTSSLFYQNFKKKR